MNIIYIAFRASKARAPGVYTPQHDTKREKGERALPPLHGRIHHVHVPVVSLI